MKILNMKNLFFIFAGFFYKSDVEQKKSDQQKGEKDLGIDTDIYNIHKFAFSSNSKAVSIDNIARTISAVKVKTLSIDERPEAVKVMMAAPIQPAERLVKSPERTLNWKSVNSNLGNINVIVENLLLKIKQVYIWKSSRPTPLSGASSNNNSFSFVPPRSHLGASWKATRFIHLQIGREKRGEPMNFR